MTSDCQCDNKKPFRLLDLPDEIWTRIGKMAIDDAPFFNCDPCTIHYPPDTAVQPSITRVCRVLRAELLPHYYATKVYTPVTGGSVSRLTGTWLRAIGVENRKHVRGVCVVAAHDQPDEPRRKIPMEWQVTLGVDLELRSGRIEYAEEKRWLYELKFL